VAPATEDGGGTKFADYVWKPIVLIEMKRRGVKNARFASRGGRNVPKGRRSPSLTFCRVQNDTLAETKSPCRAKSVGLFSKR
jgi:hypothetical protein